jgi:hypothetical protein
MCCQMSALTQLNTSPDQCHGCHVTPGKDSESFKYCGRCKKAKYCSKICQRANWSVHKGNCVAVKPDIVTPPVDDACKAKIVIADKFMVQELSKISGTLIKSVFNCTENSQCETSTRKVTKEEYYTVIAKTIKFYRLCVAIPEEIKDVSVERCYVSHIAKKCLDNILEGKTTIPKETIESLEFKSVLNSTILDMDETCLLETLSKICV